MRRIIILLLVLSCNCASGQITSSPYFGFFAAKSLPPTGILDSVAGALPSWSLYRLRTAYSGANIRVRRGSDNVEQDINLSGDYLDTTSLKTFAGVSPVYVTTWYDQSTNGVNLTQTTASEQPEINSINGRWAIVFDGVDDALQSAASAASQPVSAYCAISPLSVPAATKTIYSGGSSINSQSITITTAGTLTYRAGSNINYTPNPTINNWYQAVATWNGATSTGYLNGTAANGDAGTNARSNYRLGMAGTAGSNSHVAVIEIINYPATLNSQVRNNQNWRIAIY